MPLKKLSGYSYAVWDKKIPYTFDTGNRIGKEKYYQGYFKRRFNNEI